MMITDKQLHLIIRAGVLLNSRSRHVVSEFEIETMAEVASRFGRFKRDAVVTEAEWRVIEDAVEAMEKALVRRMAGVIVEAAA